MKRANVLMIVIDCLRSDRIFGADRSCKTPNIDRLAAASVCLPNMFVENSATAPAFANIFTGCYSLFHGVTALFGVKMNPDLFTLADAFTANGYHTYAEVTGPLMPLLGMDRGFDEYHYRSQEDYFFTPWGAQLLEKFRRRELAEPWFSLVHFWELHEPRQIRPEFDAPEWGASSFDRALSGLDVYLGELLSVVGPDTVVILTGDHGERIDEKPHPDSLLPYFMKKLNVKGRDENESRMGEDIALLNKRGKELHEVSSNLRVHSSEHGGRINLWGRIRLMLKLVVIGLTRFRIQKYQGGLKGLKENLLMKLNDFKLAGAVLRGSAEDAQMHLLRTTLSQFHLEHGFHLYDYLAKVPFLIAGLQTGNEGKQMPGEVRNIDIFPTLCDLFSLEMHELPWHGTSFRKQLLDGARPEMRMYLEVRGGAQAIHAFYIRGVRAGRHKLAYAPCDDQAPWELYDLLDDPLELNNIVADHRDLADRLHQESEALARAFQAEGSSSDLSDAEQLAMIEKLKSLGYM